MSKRSEKFKSFFSPGSLFRRWISFFGWVVVLFFIAGTFWIHFGPEKPVLNDQRKELGTKAIETITEEIRLNRKSINRVILLHFANDPTDFISHGLRDELNQSGVLNLNDFTLKERVRYKLNLREDGYKNRKAALAQVKGSEVDGVLWGKIEKFESSKKGTVLIATWELVELKSGKVVCEGKINYDTSKKFSRKVKTSIDKIEEDLEPVRETAGSVPWYIRFLIFIFAILLLPIFTISFLRAMVSKHSNTINAFVLGVYTLIGAILAFFLVGADLSSGWNVCFFLAAVAVAFIYNGSLMKFALKLES